MSDTQLHLIPASELRHGDLLIGTGTDGPSAVYLLNHEPANELSTLLTTLGAMDLGPDEPVLVCRPIDPRAYCPSFFCTGREIPDPERDPDFRSWEAEQHSEECDLGDYRTGAITDVLTGYGSIPGSTLALAVALPLPAEPASRSATGTTRRHGERIDAAGRLGWLPVIEIVPGDAVALPHCPVTAVRATDTLVITTWRSLAQRVFDRAAWALVFRPDQPTASCTGCGRTWLEGCDPGCKRRLLFEEDLLTDFDADSLVLGAFNRSGVTWPPGHQGGPGNA